MYRPTTNPFWFPKRVYSNWVATKFSSFILFIIIMGYLNMNFCTFSSSPSGYQSSFFCDIFNKVSRMNFLHMFTYRFRNLFSAFDPGSVCKSNYGLNHIFFSNFTILVFQITFKPSFSKSFKFLHCIKKDFFSVQSQIIVFTGLWLCSIIFLMKSVKKSWSFFSDSTCNGN